MIKPGIARRIEESWQKVHGKKQSLVNPQQQSPSQKNDSLSYSDEKIQESSKASEHKTDSTTAQIPESNLAPNSGEHESGVGPLNMIFDSSQNMRKRQAPTVHQSTFVPEPPPISYPAENDAEPNSIKPDSVKSHDNVIPQQADDDIHLDSHKRHLVNKINKDATEEQQKASSPQSHQSQTAQMTNHQLNTQNSPMSQENSLDFVSDSRRQFSSDKSHRAPIPAQATEPLNHAFHESKNDESMPKQYPVDSGLQSPEKIKVDDAPRPQQNQDAFVHPPQNITSKNKSLPTNSQREADSTAIKSMANQQQFQSPPAFSEKTDTAVDSRQIDKLNQPAAKNASLDFEPLADQSRVSEPSHSPQAPQSKKQHPQENNFINFETDTPAIEATEISKPRVPKEANHLYKTDNNKLPSDSHIEASTQVFHKNSHSISEQKNVLNRSTALPLKAPTLEQRLPHEAIPPSTSTFAKAPQQESRSTADPKPYVIEENFISPSSEPETNNYFPDINFSEASKTESSSQPNIQSQKLPQNRANTQNKMQDYENESVFENVRKSKGKNPYFAETSFPFSDSSRIEKAEALSTPQSINSNAELSDSAPLTYAHEKPFPEPFDYPAPASPVRNQTQMQNFNTSADSPPENPSLDSSLTKTTNSQAQSFNTPAATPPAKPKIDYTTQPQNFYTSADFPRESPSLNSPFANTTRAQNQSFNTPPATPHNNQNLDYTTQQQSFNNSAATLAEQAPVAVERSADLNPTRPNSQEVFFHGSSSSAVPILARDHFSQVGSLATKIEQENSPSSWPQLPPAFIRQKAFPASETYNRTIDEFEGQKWNA
ncbi:MAG: hypothetical protein HRT88_13395 [Lentisphaeraceae bacterium]|nr:hypothetical protein [Lentisphaeraceae bacterium]